MKQLVCLLALVQASFLVGCNSPASVDGVVPVAGMVQHEGQPVAGATVTFAPDGSGRACTGATDENGRFELTTLQPGDGAMPGKYKVLISKSEVVGAMSEDEESAYLEEHGRAPAITVKEFLPVKYKTPKTSDLTAEVTESGENHFTFDLAG
ncbi:MAG: carboxypeptidase-like regulatory domain-containing protein [Novipirellula sp. JB048]